MKVLINAVKLVMLFSIFISVQAFGDDDIYYLSCVNDKKEFNKDDPFARLPFDQFLDKWAKESAQQIIKIDNRLVLLKDTEMYKQDREKVPDYIKLADENSIDSYLKFDTPKEAKEFCSELENLCKKTFPDPTQSYPYPMADKNGTHEFWRIGFAYINDSKQRRNGFCPFD